ncbi:MAG: HNH endonuclease [Bifidobacteriaceae bacterium]|nr:HNH endonuclease [Bifidobacteriaceae bacterium]
MSPDPWGSVHSRRAWLQVADRYGTVCHICRKPIDLSATPKTPWAKSVDHLIPRKYGGGNHISNLRPAHFGCNSRRGARIAKPRPLGESGKSFFTDSGE